MAKRKAVRKRSGGTEIDRPMRKARSASTPKTGVRKLVFKTETTSDIPADEADAFVALAMSDPLYVQHVSLPEGDGQFTIVVVLRVPDLA